MDLGFVRYDDRGMKQEQTTDHLSPTTRVGIVDVDLYDSVVVGLEARSDEEAPVPPLWVEATIDVGDESPRGSVGLDRLEVKLASCPSVADRE